MSLHVHVCAWRTELQCACMLMYIRVYICIYIYMYMVSYMLYVTELHSCV